MHIRKAIYLLFGLLFLFPSCSEEKKALSVNTPHTTGHQQMRKGHENISSSDLINTGIESVTEQTNEPPYLTDFKLVMERSGNTVALRIDASAIDPEGEATTIETTWFRNDVEASKGATFADFQRGDKIVVEVRPFDGVVYGLPRKFQYDIQNTPPKIAGTNSFQFQENTYSIKINATDDDGDELTYKLTKGPPGMTVHSATGLVTWQVPPDAEGDFPSEVKVGDGHGGEATYQFTASIKFEPVKRE